ncbi:Bag family molecular chaperone regulator 5 protein [Thalictrum thalictroides]|uniref:Bag family molecular chaperone regulator 5 protein n=1 Tax=Thalictrum thalictroides TaxID=46969 RepID=A0A7J6XEH8_THATH|nr:Bag family molecular chaperone regulator 5 protein [Thalictrum thalictroides]
MEDLFGSRYLNMNSSPNHYQRSSKTRNRDIPVERNPFSSPKVVSIPVHYVGNTTSTSSRSKAALGIQRVFRGFLVRKRVKVILGIKKEVDEIENKFWDKGFVDLLKKDGKERLKLNEILMGLLFKLDSIRGIDSGVRELRKGVISKVIMLQERLDSIVAEQEALDQEEVEDVEQNEEMVSDLGEELGEEDSNSGDNVDGKVEKQAALNSESVEEGNLGEYCATKEGEEDVTVEIKCMQEEKKDNGMKELMEKVMAKNEMLIEMVADLCEKNKVQSQVNQMQARLLNSLLKRVDNLEKSFRSERSKCKKQRRQVAGSQDANKKP